MNCPPQSLQGRFSFICLMKESLSYRRIFVVFNELPLLATNFLSPAQMGLPDSIHELLEMGGSTGPRLFNLAPLQACLPAAPSLARILLACIDHANM